LIVESGAVETKLSEAAVERKPVSGGVWRVVGAAVFLALALAVVYVVYVVKSRK